MEEEFDEWDESEEPTFEENIEDDDFLWIEIIKHL